MDQEWLGGAVDWRFDTEGLHIVPGRRRISFVPTRVQSKDNTNACLLYTEVTGDFTAVTHVRAELVGFGDAAALTVRTAPAQWAKLCLERSPIGDISVVSVVTNPWSDDANNEVLPGPECALRITRRGDVFGMHYSLDGKGWRFVRTFGLALPETVMVGVHAQAPFVGGCHATFSCFELSPQPVMDFRSGE